MASGTILAATILVALAPPTQAGSQVMISRKPASYLTINCTTAGIDYNISSVKALQISHKTSLNKESSVLGTIATSHSAKKSDYLSLCYPLSKFIGAEERNASIQMMIADAPFGEYSCTVLYEEDKESLAYANQSPQVQLNLDTSDSVSVPGLMLTNTMGWTIECRFQEEEAGVLTELSIFSVDMQHTVASWAPAQATACIEGLLCHGGRGWHIVYLQMGISSVNCKYKTLVCKTKRRTQGTMQSEPVTLPGCNNGATHPSHKASALPTLCLILFLFRFPGL